MYGLGFLRVLRRISLRACCFKVLLKGRDKGFLSDFKRLL